MAACFHCDLPADLSFSAQIDGETRVFCCIGCQAVACAIADNGLSAFYQFRDAHSQKASVNAISFLHYDQMELQHDFVVERDQNHSEALLSISGISCAACAWLIEQHLQSLSGISRVKVNVTNAICLVEWENNAIKLSEIFAALHRIGYEARPHSANLQQQQRRKKHRAMLSRLGIAGIGMMQVGMFAIALHAGAIQDMTPDWQHFFRWLSLIVATPVVLYAAQPFFRNAFRSLKTARPGMDVPVALAIGLAYIASAWATFSNQGEVYFDSISMFTFFLLLGRFLEMKVRHSSFFIAENFSQLLPLTATRVIDEVHEVCPLRMLKDGDVVRVAAGDVVPCDGEVVEGEGWTNEMLLSGESEPQVKTPGAKLWAGAINGETPLVFQVSATGAATKLASVERIVNRAMSEKPTKVTMADTIASYFVSFVLIASLSAALIWYQINPDKALWVALSVLVVSCPCALSLATPAALTAAALHLKKLGILVTSASFVEKLNDINHLVFDKTGTLSEGKLSVADVIVLPAAAEGFRDDENHDSENQDALLSIIASLESGSSHPIASAFSSYPILAKVKKIKVHPAKGVEGFISDDVYRFGREDFACPGKNLAYPGAGIWLLLSRNHEPQAWVLLRDKPRAELSAVLHDLNQQGVSYEIISGDRRENVAEFAQKFGITNYSAAAEPDEKLRLIQARQTQHKHVLMVGDGINDVPGLAGAAASMAIANSTQLAQSHADAILLSEKLSAIPQALVYAKKAQAVIRQNLLWALAYNLIALPAAMLGLIPPYIAALGMSLSSLVVVLNSLRLNFGKAKKSGDKGENAHAKLTAQGMPDLGA